jgi:glycogen debranching enzyme
MALEVTVGPPRLAINQGYGVLITDQDGQVPWPTDKGFYHWDTRVISSWLIFANGCNWNLLNSANISHFAARIFLANPTIATEIGDIAAGTLSLSIGRRLDGGLHEDLDIVNNGQHAVMFNLEIVVRSDFADLFEVKSGHIVRRGRITTAWSQARRRLTTAYRNKDFQRIVTVTAKRCPSAPVYANGRISFQVALEPGQAWHSCLLYEISDGQSVARAPRGCVTEVGQASPGSQLGDWQKAVMKVESSNEELYRFYRQSLDDMYALRLPIRGTDHLQFVPSAGVPWFVALFGRDSLIVSLQNAMVYPDFARGALEVLAGYQATKRDDYRDAEPGKILHELRRGELAHFKLIPHTPYYGTADATILYLIVLHSAWRSTGDPGLLESCMPAAEKCLRWIDHYGDRDGDGFQEYETRSSAGYYNQGWKDSGEALVNTDGSMVKTPIALVELQGYVYDAWLRMAQIYDFLGKSARARTLRKKAKALFEHFNEAFWDEASGYYAFCLDGDKKPVLSVASNPGHCLWSGIVPPDRAAKVVKRLMAPDMWSGWGIRTLSSEHVAYNPNSYQNGAVWPHDNSLIAMGFRRYGYVAEAQRIARDISGAAGYFMLHQLPELYSGLQRDPTNFPVQYLGANVPQAWAAGSCFTFLQMLLGFQPDAPAGKLYIDPELPPWLDELTLRDLRVGRHMFDLLIRREGLVTRFEVLKGDAAAVEYAPFATAIDRWV